MKTTKSQFNEFKQEFLRYVELLGLKDWKIYFRHEDIDGFAQIIRNANESIATVSFCSELNREDMQDLDIKMNAKHEAIHLLLSRYNFIASCRFVNDGEVSAEEERIVRILEKVL